MKFLGFLLQLSLFVAGLGLVIYHERVIEEYDKRFGPEDDRQVVATVLDTSGNVRYKLPKTLVYKNAKKDLDLKLRDTISTDSESTTKIRFNDGLELEVGENSFLVLDENQDDDLKGIRISFLRGNFKVLKRGKAGKATLVKNAESGKLKEDVVIDPSANASAKPIVIRSTGSKDFQKLLQQKEQEVTQAEKAVLDDEGNQSDDLMEKPDTDIGALKLQDDANKLEAKKIEPKKQKKKIKKSVFELREEKETLPESYIVDVIKKQKPFFNRCYAQHLRLNPEAKGRIDFSFTINPKGKVIDVRVLRATINDPRLHQCSMNVIERASFRAFSGDPVVVNYPFYFE